MKGCIFKYDISSTQDYNGITDWRNKQSKLLCDVRDNNALVSMKDFLIYKLPISFKGKVKDKKLLHST